MVPIVFCEYLRNQSQSAVTCIGMSYSKRYTIAHQVLKNHRNQEG